MQGKEKNGVSTKENLHHFILLLDSSSMTSCRGTTYLLVLLVGAPLAIDRAVMCHLASAAVCRGSKAILERSKQSFDAFRLLLNTVVVLHTFRPHGWILLDASERRAIPNW
jgi:hypothetical protein